MLLELSIRDFAIIDELRIGFEPGFNALTGETGAGKSILIDALGAVLGERSSAEVVRTGAATARIEATFDVSDLSGRDDVQELIDELGIEPDDGVLVFTREILASGRSAARINGRTVTAGTLSRVGTVLVDIHGQSDHLSLLRPAEHLDILDRYGGLLLARQRIAEQVSALREVRAKIRDLTENQHQRARREDFLRFQLAEISAVNPTPREDAALADERSVLANAERLVLSAGQAHLLLSGGEEETSEARPVTALAALRLASEHLREIVAVDASMRPLADRLDEVIYSLEDVATELRSYRDQPEADPNRLSIVEDRLAAIKDLTRKYGATIDDVLRAQDAAARELEELTTEEGGLDALREREALLREQVGRLASELSGERSRAGEALAQATESVMAELNMGRARFAVRVTQSADPEGVPVLTATTDGDRVAVDATGADRVEFLIAPDAGEALKPLGRVASGGETARLMLALKSILSAADATPTLVFDEIDVGVGGRSGHVVGEKLWGLSRDHQVLVITHLPQIAAFADAHFRIAKGEREGRVVSDVDVIDDEARAEELAAMIDGLPVTRGARQSALDILTRVREWKASTRRQTHPSLG